MKVQWLKQTSDYPQGAMRIIPDNTDESFELGILYEKLLQAKFESKSECQGCFIIPLCKESEAGK